MEVAFSQRQRLRFIESVVFWEGAIDRPRVAKAFGVTENHVTKDFGLYRKQFPGNLDYDLSHRSYRPGRKFRPRLTSGTAEEYLALLRVSREAAEGADGFESAVAPTVGDGVHVELIPAPIGRVDPSTLKDVTRALRQGTGLRIVYQSLQTRQATDREVWPHTLVFAGARWHVRAFDSKYDDFIDLVLQRIRKTVPTENPAPKAAQDDMQWNQRVRVTLVPRADLSTEQQEVIALEFGMENIKGHWRWRADVRECLVPYFLESMALGPNIAHLHPKLHLLETELLKTHSFPTSRRERSSSTR
uniref:Uncharacterized protein n=1 Tax=mine drainage metagenome TaxID=410659 RepID=E6PKQ2_9ZZZZ